jgi:hypothetical protein
MKRLHNQSQQEWIDYVDKSLFGLWNTYGFSYFFTGIYIGDKTSTLTFAKGEKATDYTYTIHLEGDDEDVILTATFKCKIICVYIIKELLIFPKPKKLILADTIGKLITFISQE